jgi:opacity protein-like surface antigen
MKRFNAVAVLLMISMAVASAFAAQTPIDISSEANDTWCPALENCTTMPTGKVAYNGVTFEIPTSPNNDWYAGESGESGTVTLAIPISIANVKTVYMLMNTAWGSKEKGLLSVTFTTASGISWTYQLIGGTNIRDYNNGEYTNSIDCALPNVITEKAGSAGTVSAFKNGEGQRLDMQLFELPTEFAGQTLASITITDNGALNVQRAILAAVTVSTAAP